MYGKVLYVGDPHITVDAIEEGERLMDGVCTTALEEGVREICILGDLHHNHSVIRVEVLHFWKRAIEAMKAVCKVRAIVGNHDLSYTGDGDALMAYPEADIVRGFHKEDGILYISYQSDVKEIERICQQHYDCFGLVCHQAFRGSVYESGMAVGESESVDPDVIPQKWVISGHIHSPGRIGKVTYAGAPRWRTLNDANKDRNLPVVEHHRDGNMIVQKYVDTSKWCRRIHKLEDRETSPIQTPIPEGDVRVDVFGTLVYLNRRVPELKALGCRVRDFRLDAPAAQVRESEGVGVAFRRYRSEYRAPQGTPTNVLEQETEGVV